MKKGGREGKSLNRIGFVEAGTLNEVWGIFLCQKIFLLHSRLTFWAWEAYIYAPFIPFVYSRRPSPSLPPSVVFLRFCSTLASYSSSLPFWRQHRYTKLSVVAVCGCSCPSPKPYAFVINQLFICVHTQSLAPPLLVQALESNSNN